jgi:uncharacterized protein YyaL (SSP411 family)
MTRLVDLDATTMSPYLVQHISNPVEWHEWGADAFSLAAQRDVPVLLSVGYSACHWCHVMAHESFEDTDTAASMNEHFVNIKVDREERPDVDRVYMDAVQAMTGRGGWPMTVFMTPTGEPFFAGTYFPAEDRQGHPSFRSVLAAITEAWNTSRDQVEDQASRLTAAATQRIPPAPDNPGTEAIDGAIAALLGGFDPISGGFGGAPKFPQAPNLELWLRYLALEPDGTRTNEVHHALTTTLDRMADGGIYDHLGGGFARYSVDDHWLVPHFEKMLYDNALLARIYLRAWQVTGTHRYLEIATETLDYLLRDMSDAAGGIHTAEDADSEGIEGKFYVWSQDEIERIVGSDSDVVTAFYGVTATGNFEGVNILHRPPTSYELSARLGRDDAEVQRSLEAARSRLLAARDQRVRPGKDDKVLAAWNGLAMRSFAEAGTILGESRYLDAARRVARFMSGEMTDADGRIMRSWRGGATSVAGFCDDYAAAAIGYLTLYQATGELEWFQAGRAAVDQMIRRFAAPEGGFYATEADDGLVTRPMNLMDNPTPSDNALAAEALLILNGLTGEAELEDQFAGVLRAGGVLIERHPEAVGHLIAVMATAASGVKQVAIVGNETRTELAAVVWEAFRPECVVALGDGGPTEVPLLDDRPAGSDGRLAYVCRGFVCDLPVTDAADLRGQLAEVGP